jgi:tetratricopeptide (TPR) repeat protein
MKRIFSRGSLVAATMFAPLALSAIGFVCPAVAADGVRPEVGKPLQDAASDIKAGRYREALGKVQEAEAVSGKTANETFLIEQMRFSAAQGAGDMGAASSALEALSASGRLAPAQRLPMTFGVATGYYRANDYKDAQIWLERYRKDGGTDPQARTLLVQTYYLTKDCAGVQREVGGAGPQSETDLQLLATCYRTSGDNNGYANAMEKLVTYFPKKDYWAEVLNRTTSRTGFSGRLELDVLRLRFLTGNLSTGPDLENFGETSLSEGYPGEAKKAMAQGFSSNAFAAGVPTEKAKRLNDLITKSLAEVQATGVQHDAEAAAAPTGDQMVNLGFAKVLAGNYDAGIAQMEQGIQKDKLAHPDDAKLHLGEAYIMANKKAKGRDILRSVKGTDGTQDVARLWLIYSGGA